MFTGLQAPSCSIRGAARSFIDFRWALMGGKRTAPPHRVLSRSLAGRRVGESPPGDDRLRPNPMMAQRRLREERAGGLLAAGRARRDPVAARCYGCRRSNREFQISYLDVI